MSNTDFSKLAKMAEEILTGKEFFVSSVLDRVREAQTYFPRDQAMRTAEEILKNRLNKQGSLATMTQMDFQRIFNDTANLGNRTAFREMLGDFLLVEAASATAHYNQEFTSGLRNSDSEIDIVNKDLAEELGSLFSAATSTQIGSFIDKGRCGLALELSSMGFTSPVEVVGKTAEFVVYATEIPSTRGRIPAYFPAEIKLGSVLMPSVFVSGSEFKELSKDNLELHARSVAAGMKTVQAHEILSALTKSCETHSEFVKAADDGTMSIDITSPGLYHNSIESAPEMLSAEMPQMAVPNELQHLTEGAIKDALIEAGLSFDRKTVTAAKNLVAAELRTMGIHLDNIAIASEFDGGIMIAAQLRGTGGNKTIEVPVEISHGRILMPSVFTSGTHVDSFDKNAIKSFANQKMEGVFNAAFSNKIGWTYKQLHNHALKSAAYGKYVEAEETLAVIAEEFGDEFHKSAFADLVDLLNVGIQDEEKPLDAMDKYMKEAMAKAADSENNIKMSSTLMYLYPED